MPERGIPIPRAAFERLIHAHHAAVYRTCLRIVRDEATALDVTQQVYVALLEGRVVLTGDGDERVLRWFAVRASLQELRGNANRRAREEDFAMRNERDDGTDPVADRDAARLVERQVALLPEDLRLAVRLRFDEDLTYAAIGEALAISEPSAHGRVQRALANCASGSRAPGSLRSASVSRTA
jgi:RNA polymerase sigma-70 factor (ECF subfamily)